MRFLLLLVLLVIFSAVYSWSLHKLENSQTNNAICNDGSPGAYYLRKGTAKKWVIHLAGGWWCWDEPSCKNRWDNMRFLMTTTHLGPTIDQYNGIFSNDSLKNPSFHDANYVWVYYCSSDSYSGDRAASPETGGFHFRGKNIIKNVIQELIDKHDMKSAAEVLFTGCSAGGMGVLINIDFVGSIVRSQIEGVKYQAFIDAGHFIDFETRLGVDGHLVQAKKGILLWNGRPNDDCAKSMEPHRCYLSQYAMKFIRNPTLIFNSQIDSFQVGYGFGNWTIDLSNPDHRKYTEYIAEKALLSFRDRGKVSIYAPNCLVHCASFDDAYTRITVMGITQRDFVERWWRSNGTTQVLIDDCRGLHCSEKC
jgi:hypothetical protein